MTELESTGVFQAGKLLTLKLDGEKYGLDVFRVVEIVGICPVTFVPGTPSYLKGVINYRGKIIPALDLALFLNPETTPSLEATSIIIISLEGATQKQIVGLLVDEVLSVVTLFQKNLEQGILSKAPNKEQSALIQMNVEGEDIIALDLNSMLKSIISA